MMSKAMADLPIESVLPELRAALSAHPCAVLEAPPGAGKTTRVPLALLAEPWLGERRIILLEPRRLAARAAARHMASLLGERVGETVGYRVRLDTRVGPRTRIEVVTEGVLTRMIQADPALEGVGLVIFDEFHERSLHADLGLALTLQAREVLREDLRVLVMSATLDGTAVAELLAGPSSHSGLPAVPVIRSEGRAYPVETRWLARRVEGPIEAEVTRVVLEALDSEDGDVLVFLPGAGEIRRVEARLVEALTGAAPSRGAVGAGRAHAGPRAATGSGTVIRVLPLYGDLPEEAQDRAIAPSPPGERKVVLATSIAETSLTIEGVRVVVDSGLMRVPRFSPRTGMTRLETVRVSRASADQRRGRAGRLGPGVCYRLWMETEDHGLAPHQPPEILEADLAPLALELATWGVSDPGELRWLDSPPAAAFAQARELLEWLGALDSHGAVTEHGRRMADLGLHPRLAHMVLKGAESGYGPLACDLAALLGGRDILRRADGPAEADLRLRLEALHEARRTGRTLERFRGHGVHAGGCARVLREAAHLRRELALPLEPGDLDACGLLVALAYPDRIARRRPGRAPRYLLANGRGATLDGDDPLATAEWLVAADLNDIGAESRIFLAAALDEAAITEHFGERIVREEVVAWDAAARAVRARRMERLGAIPVHEATIPDPDPTAVTAALLEAIRTEGLRLLPWSEAAERLRQRMRFLHHLDRNWPDVSDTALLNTLEDWIAPYLYGMKDEADLQRLDLASALEAMLGWDRKSRLDAWAPDRIEVPSGSRIRIDYTDPAAPVLAVRLQEVFGWTDTPRIAGGRVPLTLHLLSPAMRPVQVTRDLSSFWRSTYFEVKKDLKGRYPKHYWPDDPLEAVPTRHVRPRG